MATVIDFPGGRARAAQPAASSPPAQRQWWKFKPKPTPKTNQRNGYDAAFKGVMSRRAQQLITELQIATYRWKGDLAECDARINWVIGEIRKIRDEVTASVEEHHPPGETR